MDFKSPETLFLLLILVFIALLVVGCVSSTNDKAFHDKAVVTSDELGKAIIDWTTAISANDVNKSVETGQIMLKKYDDYISDLQQMPVTAEMEPIKQEYIASWQQTYNVSKLQVEVSTYMQKGDYAKAKEVLNESIELGNLNNDHQSSADQMYYELYPLVVSTATISNQYEINIIYHNSWQGNYGDESGQQSINGNGVKKYQIDYPSGPLVVLIQKQDDSNSKLTIEIMKGGEVLATKSTTSPYGIVTLTYYPSRFG